MKDEKRKLRVLWFSNTPAAGDDFSADNCTGGWLKSLDKAIQDKIDLHVAFYDRKYPEHFQVRRTNYYSLASKDKLKLIRRRILLFWGKNPDISVYLKLIDEVKPDVIHIHGTEKNFIHIAGHTTVPVVLSIQSIQTVMNHKYFSGIKKTELSLLYFFNDYYKAYKDFLKQGEIERECVKRLKYVIGRTDWDRRVYSVLAPGTEYFTCNEILRDSFYRNEWTEHFSTQDKMTVHTTMGPLLFKGFETICMTVSLLDKAGYRIEWRVAGVGTDSEINRIVKRKLGREYPSEGLVLLGSLNESDLVDRMLESDIFVSPTHQDNSSNALCEAMMLGMPCISTFAGGCGSLITDKVNGLLVQDGDPWALAGAVVELSQNRHLALSLGTKARKDSLMRHSPETITENLLDIYSTVCRND